MTNLRQQLETLAAGARPYGDGSAAISTARRRRSIRQAAIAGAAVLMVTGTATLWAQNGRTTATPQPPATGPTVIYYRDGSVLAEFTPPYLEAPVGLVVNHVLAELNSTPGTALTGMSWGEIRDGGYTIVTTIDPTAQHLLETTADEEVYGSLMAGQPANLQAAAVVVEAGTGRVLAYYGGHEGTGNDYAGIYRQDNGDMAGFGRHVPGGSFMVYTLAAALGADISLNSRWQWTEHPQAGRPVDNPVRNGDRTCPDSPNGSTCSLLDSVVASLPVPLVDVTLSASPASVLAAARAAGVDYIWNNELERYDLRTLGPEATAVAGNFGVELGIGQYPVTVLDQANAMATYAAGGLRAQAHFVSEVRRGGELVYNEMLPVPDGPRILEPGQVADLTYALTRISGQEDLALKPGEWQYGGGPTANSNAWSVGYTSELAVAVWVGNLAEEQPIVDREGRIIYGTGLPTQILRQVVADTQTALGLSPTPFPPPVFGGQLLPVYAWLE